MDGKLSQGPRVTYDARVGAGLSRGPKQSRLLNSAAWSQTWPAPGATLDLDFANNRGFVRGSGHGGVMDAITFTRASNAAFVGPDGLLKGGSPNKLYSSQVGGLNWLVSAGSTIILDAGVAPDGTNTASLQREVVGFNSKEVTTPAFNWANNWETFTIYAKADGRDWLLLRMVNLSGTIRRAWFNISTGVLGTVDPDLTATIEDAGNGWYRCRTSIVAPNYSNTRLMLAIVVSNGQFNTQEWNGDSTKGAYLWGAQVEANSVPTSFNANNINVPRFDWGSNAVVNGNQLRNTQTLNSWQTYRAITLSDAGIAAPDGSFTAKKIAATTATDIHLINHQDISGGLKVFSCYIKSAGIRYAELSGEQTNSGQAVFDLQTGAVGISSNLVSSGMIDVGDGWYRCYVVTSFANSIRAQIVLRVNPTGTASYTGDGTSGLYVWGLQVEFGDQLTPYKEVGAFAPTNTPLAANSTCNGILIEEARTNRALWCRDATSGTGTNIIYGSASAVHWLTSNGSIAGTLGAELITNGDFSNGSTGWTTGSSTTISGGVATIGNGGTTAMQQPNVLQAGKLYNVTFQLVSASVGNDAKFHASIWAPEVNIFGPLINSTAGTYSAIMTSSSVNFTISNFNSFSIQVDNISVKELIPTGVPDPFGGSTAVVLTANGANATFIQQNYAPVGPYTFSVWLRRKTGTGDVQISCINGSWVTQTITNSWVRYSISQNIANVNISPGIRIVTAGDEVEIWGPQLVPGFVLTDYQPTITVARVGWSKSNVTLAKNQTGIDGVTNAATSITANVANAVLIQPVLLGSGNRTCSVYLKRITGTGDVQVTLDGTTWSTVDLSSAEWRRVALRGLVTNPVLGIRLATNGDAVAMDYAQVEDGSFATSPILTTSATATRSVDSASIGGNINTRIGEERLYSPRGSTIYTEYGRASNLGGDVFRIWGAGSAISTISVNGQAAVVGISGTYAVGATGFVLSDFNRACVSYSRSKLNFSASGISSVQRNENNINIFGSVIWIGNYGNGSGMINGCIKRIVFAPFDLSTEGTKNMTSAT